MDSTGTTARMPKPTLLLVASQILAFIFEISMMLQTGYLDLKVSMLLTLSSYIFLAINIRNNNRGKGLLLSTVVVCLLFLVEFEANTGSGIFPFLQSVSQLILMLGLVAFSLKNVGIKLFVALHSLFLTIYKISFWVYLILTLSLSLESFGYYNYPTLLLMSLGIGIFCKVAIYKAAMWIASGTALVKTKERRDAYVFDIEPMDMKQR